MVEKKPKIKTKVFPHKYNGYKLFAVFEVDEDGKQVDKEKPIVSFGKTKAKGLMVLIAHMDEFIAWCENEGLQVDNEVYDG